MVQMPLARSGKAGQLFDTEVDGSPRQLPIYALIAERLRKGIQQNLLPQGSVLLEGHVANLLNSTRTPVRQALHALEEEALVSRFEGRGYLVGPMGTPPRRITLSAEMLGIDSPGEPVRKTMGWEAIYNEVERDVVHLSVFDKYRINEVELARHFGVGRMVARDVLLRLESLGLLEKDERLRWMVTPLDAARINHLYELRWLLEPAALRSAMVAAPSAVVKDMIDNLRKAMKSYPDISRTDLDKLEHDLHVEFMARCGNKDLLQSLQRTRCILTLSKHVLGVSAPMPKRDPFMAEHLAIFKAIARSETGKAEDLLRAHLEVSCAKVSQRVAMVRDHYPTPDLPYIA
jgi:DNA-binding GntR family transcriptional regulator